MSTPTPNVIDLLDTTPEELSLLMVQPDMPNILTNLFEQRQVSLALLREYSFITIGMNQLRREMNRHVTERNALFTVLTTNQHFQETLLPLLTYFRQQQEHDSSPSSRVPSPKGSVLFEPTDGTLTSLTETSEITEYVDDTLHITSHDSPRTIEIHSPPPENSPSPTPETASHSFRTANENPLGSPFNPIDVDLIPDHLVRLNTGMRRSRSTLAPLYCQTCLRHGHVETGCIWQEPIVCDYCERRYHGQKDCPVLRRDMARYNPRYNFCMVCSQPGHTLERCMALQYPE
jgi:hypothetical protein